MRFSIIIPVYNAEKYIKRAVDSIIVQEFQDYEVILIDDGSTDRSGEILDELKLENSKLRVEHIENHGVSYARNKGIDLASGEYVLFIDSDDVYEAEALKQLDILLNKNKNVEFLCFGYTEYNIQGEKIKKTKYQYLPIYLDSERKIKEKSLELITNSMFGSVWSKVYKRDILIKHNIRMREDIYIGEDYCFNLEVLRHCRNFWTVDCHLYRYMVENSTSIIRRYNPDKFEQMYKMHLIRGAFIDTYVNAPKIEKEIQNHMNFIRLSISCFMDLFRRECSFSFRDKLRYIRDKMQMENQKYDKRYLKYLNFKQKIVYKIVVKKNVFIIYLFSAICFYLKFYLGIAI